MSCIAILLTFYGLADALTDHQYVIDIDFDAPPRKLHPDDIRVKMAGSAFACSSPEKESGNLTEHKLNLRMAGIKALNTLYGNCIFYRTKEMYWTFVLCPGKTVRQTRDSTSILLGTHDPGQDVLLDDAHNTLVQTYVNGDDGRSAKVRYECGRVPFGGFPLSAEEPAPLKYEVIVRAPFFCRQLRTEYELNAGSAAAGPPKAAKAAPEPDPPIPALLDGLNSTCLNFTQGYWTYQYCHPFRASQYHKNQDGSVGLAYELGRVPRGVKDPPMKFVARERIARESTVVLEAQPGHHRRLAVALTEGGQKCDETASQRKSTVLFECPASWHSAVLEAGKLVGVVETATCEYVFLIETALACPHPLLLPKRPRNGYQAIKCSRLDE
jgi:hypothetical protein